MNTKLPKRWLTVDPGEDTGYAIWHHSVLLDAGTEKLWPFADTVWDGLNAITDVPETAHISSHLYGCSLIVVEDFRIYPWEAKAGTLNWDQVRTARLIGALTFMARTLGIEFVLQPAKIKERAVAAGAEALYLKPLHENRHANDAIQHGVYYMGVHAGAESVESSVSEATG